MIVRLSHPWKYHHTRDLLDTDRGELTTREAAKLIRAGYAVDVDTLIEAGAGGWVTVTTSAGPQRVQGREKAIELLRADSRP